MASDLSHIVKSICEEIGEVTDHHVRPEDVDPSASLIGDLGLDSLDFAQVYLRCRDRLEIHGDDSGTDWSSVQTVTDLALVLRNQT